MNALREVSVIIAAVGTFGFLVCFGVGAAAEWRLGGYQNHIYPTGKATVQITQKGMTGYVEKDYADRLRRAEEYLTYFWLLAVPGFVGLTILRKYR